MDRASSSAKPTIEKPADGLDFAAVIEAKRDGCTFNTQAERLAEAAVLEQCRQQAGQSPALQAPWPASTIEFLRQHARNFHE